MSQPLFAAVLGLVLGASLYFLARASYHAMNAEDPGRGLALVGLALVTRLFFVTIVLYVYKTFAPDGFLGFGLALAGSFLVMYTTELVRYAGLHRYARPVAGSRGWEVGTRVNPLEQLPGKIEELVHELSVLPYDNMEGTVEGAFVLTNYVVWGLIALFTVMVIFIFVANREKRQMKLATESGDVKALAPAGRFVGMIELGVEFIRDMATDVIGEKDGKKFVPLLGTFFFMILVTNFYGLLPAGKSMGGTIGGAVGLALISWVVYVWVGFTRNGAYGYLKSLIPSGVREMSFFGRTILGGFIFLLEFVSTFIVRPLTLAVRLFANLYAGHIILGVFSAFVALFWPIIDGQLATWSIGGISVGVGAISFVFLILMYAFEVFVAFIQAYVFTILTAVYIQSSVHASEH